MILPSTQAAEISLKILQIDFSFLLRNHNISQFTWEYVLFFCYLYVQYS